MNSQYLNRITNADCIEHLPLLNNESIDLFLSDIPYGIGLDDWDVLHNNTNSAYLGKSPAQEGKSGFKRRGKPINGWSLADRNIGKEYQEWCFKWSSAVFPKMKAGASVFVFGARRTLHRVINAFEDSGFLLKDVLAWKKTNAHHRAQKVSIVFERRNLPDKAAEWSGWRLGNLAPIYEPVAWFFKPYKITIADNILKNGVGAMNTEACQTNGSLPTNLLEFGFASEEERIHEAQKPLELIEFLIKLVTKENQIVLDPFMGSGTTALAAQNLSRRFIGFEINPHFCELATVRLTKTNQSAANSKTEEMTLFKLL